MEKKKNESIFDLIEFVGNLKACLFAMENEVKYSEFKLCQALQACEPVKQHVLEHPEECPIGAYCVKCPKPCIFYKAYKEYRDDIDSRWYNVSSASQGLWKVRTLLRNAREIIDGISGMLTVLSRMLQEKSC